MHRRKDEGRREQHQEGEFAGEFGNDTAGLKNKSIHSTAAPSIQQKQVVWSLAWLVVMLGLLPGGRRGPQPTLTSGVMVGVSLIFTLTLGGFFIVCAHCFILTSPSISDSYIQYVCEVIFMWCLSLCSWVTFVSFWSKSGALVSLLDNLETVPLCTISHTGFAWRAIAAMLPNLSYFLLHCHFYIIYITLYSSIWMSALFAASIFWLFVTPSVPAVFVVVLLRLVHDSLVSNNAALERVLAGNPTTTRKTLSVNPTGNPNETSTIWPENPTGTITAWPGNPTGNTTAWPGYATVWPRNPNGTLTSVPGNSKAAPINTIMAWNRNTPMTLVQVHARNLELRRLYRDLERVLSIPLLCYDALAIYTLINSFFFNIATYNTLVNVSSLSCLVVTNFFSLGVLGSIGLLADSIRDKAAAPMTILAESHHKNTPSMGTCVVWAQDPQKVVVYKLAERPLNFSVGGLFPLSFTNLIGMMGAASTYLVIFLQFETSK